MRRVIVILLMVLLTHQTMAQNGLDLTSVFEYVGMSDAENADMYELERLADLLEHPLRMRRSDFRRIKESGLFSPYQLASLADYMSRHGDILSLPELSAVDGFNMEIAAVLAPFLSFDPALDGEWRASRKNLISSEMTTRTFMKNEVSGHDASSRYSHGMRYRLQSCAGFSATASLSNSYDASGAVPDAYAGGLSWYSERHDMKVIAGDMNARFGQGLALWNGMSMSGLDDVSSFARKPSGVTLSSSYTGTTSFTGIAMEKRLGSNLATAMMSFPGVKSGDISFLPAVNVTRLYRHGQAGVTHYADVSGLFDAAGPVRIPDMKSSVDLSFCWKGVDVFAETSFDWVGKQAASLAGISFPFADRMKIGAMMRYYPQMYNDTRCGAVRSTTKCSNEHGVSVAADFTGGKWIKPHTSGGYSVNLRRLSGALCVDAAFYPVAKAKGYKHSMQLKLKSSFRWVVSPSLQVRFRLTERIRSWGLPYRTDFRTDVTYMSGCFGAAMRFNVLCADRMGLVGYAETGWKDEKYSIYLRSGLFQVDDWDDRIYVYERDVPGAFNVPALYGRGFWASWMSSVRLFPWWRLYLRMSGTSYRFMPQAKRKPGRAELKVQCVFRI